MPCYVTGSAAGDAALSAKEAREDLSRVTRVACELAKFASQYKRAFSRETMEWMDKHARLDRQRIAEATARAERSLHKERGLKKLTKAEREALGL